MECEFISCLTIWRHPSCNTSITFGTGGQNAMKRAVKFYPEISEVKVFVR